MNLPRNTRNRGLFILFLGILITLFPFPADSEESEVEKRLKALEEKYKRLEKKYEDLQEKYETLKEEEAPPDVIVKEKPKTPEEEVKTAKELEEDIKSVKEDVKSLLPGKNRFLLTGWGAASYINREGDEQDSTFTARFVPIFLFQIFPNVLFEGEVEFELEDDETEVSLEYAQIDYLFSKYATAIAGKFLTPFGVFPLKLHPAWINRMPNRPLMYRSGFLPFSNVGAQLTGAFAPPSDSFRITYALSLVNGGVLEIDGEKNGDGITEEVEDIEIISDTVDITDKVGFVGRIGFIPFQNSDILNGLQIGFSWLVEKVTLEDEELENK